MFTIVIIYYYKYMLLFFIIFKFIQEKTNELMLTNPKGGSDISLEGLVGVIWSLSQPCFQRIHNKAKWYELCFL